MAKTNKIKFTIKKKFLLIIGTAIICMGVSMVLAFNTGSSKMIEVNMQAQSQALKVSIERDYKTLSSSIDHMKYLLIMDEQNRFLPAFRDKTLAKDTYKNWELNQYLSKIIRPVYGYQKYLMGVAVYSPYARLTNIGYVDYEIENQILNEGVVDFYVENQGYAVIKPIQLASQTIGRMVVQIDLPSLLQTQLEALPEGAVLKVRDESGAKIDQLGHQNKETQYYSDAINLTALDMAVELLLPKDRLLGTMNHVFLQIMIFCLAVILFTLLLGSWMVIRITRNIDKLSRGMKQVENKDLTASVAITSNDELADMGQTFNSMVGNINQLMDENQQRESEKKEIEMNFLQAQINPHFLSNTLNTIIWMAELQEAGNIARLTRSLITLLHASMYRGKDLVSLKAEVEQVRSYIAIQQVAYSASFEVFYDIPDELDNFQVLRLIIQPLVENAILHNFVDMETDKVGEIIISAEAVEQILYIRVTDNGNGFDLAELDNPKRKSGVNKQFSKIGIGNIDKRIKLYFGEDYGLTYRSKVGEFTEACISLPLIKEGDIYEESRTIG